MALTSKVLAAGCGAGAVGLRALCWVKSSHFAGVEDLTSLYGLRDDAVGLGCDVG